MSKIKPPKIVVSKTSHGKVIAVELQQVNLPVFEEKIMSGRPWVRYGSDNLFPEFLQMLASRSALHGAIVRSKIDYAFGKGIDDSEVNNASLSKHFITHPNGEESLDEIYRKLIYDYVLYGSFAVNVIWSDDGTEIAQIYHTDIAKLRSGYADEKGRVNTYYYSNQWLKGGAQEVAEIAAFDTATREGSQILYTKDYSPSSKYYALPSYVGALNSIATDCEITNFHLSHLKNGMSPSKMITFTEGEPTEEEEKAIMAQIENLYTGSDNSGKFMLSFVNDPEHAPKVDTLGADNLGDQFIQLEDSVLQQILSGHRVTSPLLVGIRSGNNGLGSNTDELYTAYTLFYNTVIKPIQDKVLGVLNTILKYTHKYNGGQLKATSNTPVEFTWSENILSQIMTKDEMRARIGLPPVSQTSADDINADSNATDTDNI